MELICPSCEARYQVPDASVGEKGRQVSCMNCGHNWHAFPPLILGSSAAPPTTASPGIDFQTPPRPGRSSSAPAYAEPDAPPAAPASGPPRPAEAPRGPDASRSEQLAEIREMLAEVQSEERAAAALAPDDDNDPTRVQPAPPAEPQASRPDPTAESAPEPLPTAGPPARREPVTREDVDEDEETDPLRRRMAMHEKQSERRRTDVERLRRRHERRASRQKRAREAGSGAFLTGFLLVVMVAAAMTALYMLQPQIVARMPGSEPMMTEYVETIDGLRVRVEDTVENARIWVLRLFDENA